MPELLDLGSDRNNTSPFPQIKRFDPKSVATKDELVPDAIEDHKPPHAAKAGEAGRTPLGISGEDHLGIRQGVKDVPKSFKFSAKLDKIINLAIIYDPKLVTIAHWLVTSGTEVQNRQSAMAQPDFPR
jgi:hypothetical protein